MTETGEEGASGIESKSRSTLKLSSASLLLSLEQLSILVPNTNLQGDTSASSTLPFRRSRALLRSACILERRMAAGDRRPGLPWDMRLRAGDEEGEGIAPSLSSPPPLPSALPPSPLPRPPSSSSEMPPALFPAVARLVPLERWPLRLLVQGHLQHEGSQMVSVHHLGGKISTREGGQRFNKR